MEAPFNEYQPCSFGKIKTSARHNCAYGMDIHSIYIHPCGKFEACTENRVAAFDIYVKKKYGYQIENIDISDILTCTYIIRSL